MIKPFWYYLGFIGSLTLLAIAYFYFQNQLGLYPCPLCVLQRVALVGVALFCILGIVFKKHIVMHWLASIGILLSTLGGLAAATRQVWLQHLPEDRIPECGPGLEYMLESFPLSEVLKSIFAGSGECAEVQWRFIGFSMAEWMVAVFTAMLVLCVVLFWTRLVRKF